MHATRLLLDRDPLTDDRAFTFGPSTWNARWIAPAGPHVDTPIVLAYRLRCALPKAARVRVHVSADARYDLYLDGARIGWGSERGDHANWFYESYDLDLAAGAHALVARVVWPGDGELAHVGHITHRPAFLLMAEEPWGEAFSTGRAAWEVKPLPGIAFVQPVVQGYYAVGARVQVDGGAYAWGFEGGDGGGWQPVRPEDWPALKVLRLTSTPYRVLRHAILPPMLDQVVARGCTRHVQELASEAEAERPLDARAHRPAEAQAWQRLLLGGEPLVVPPRTRRSVLIDLDDYFCVFPQLVLSGGRGASVRLLFAESLYEKTEGWEKGSRDTVEGKYFRGFGDTFTSDGGQDRAFEPLWWSAGRYVRLLVTTADEPLTVVSLRWRETHYPHVFEGTFTASDPRLEAVWPIARRTLEVCSHETYMDCPYYEQLMYVGDTRLQALVTYATTRDDRLPRKALLLFDESRDASGLTKSRTPSRIAQVIPPFSLWWVAMVHDYAMWRDDPAFVAARLPGVRAVLEAYRCCLNREGLIVAPEGWNFMDWVTTWPGTGIPPDGSVAVNATLNFQAALVFMLAAELERGAGEAALAQRNRRLAATIAQAAQSAFWDEGRGLFAETRAHARYSEHAQCLALLSGLVDATRQPRVIDGLLNAADLDRATIYFRHYLFETLRLTGRMETFLPRLDLWFGLTAQGLKTTVEMPEPTRSDAHAWGAHPMFHYLASVLGIRPAAPGFARVAMRPQLGALAWARGTLAHPRGAISAEVRREGADLHGQVTLPAGVSGVLLLPGRRRALRPGMNIW